MNTITDKEYTYYECSYFIVLENPGWLCLMSSFWLKHADSVRLFFLFQCDNWHLQMLLQMATILMSNDHIFLPFGFS